MNKQRRTDADRALAFHASFHLCGREEKEREKPAKTKAEFLLQLFETINEPRWDVVGWFFFLLFLFFILFYYFFFWALAVRIFVAKLAPEERQGKVFCASPPPQQSKGENVSGERQEEKPWAENS